MEVAKVINATRIFKIGEVETQALRGVNLTIESGEFTSLVGPSGSGKTTLLQLIGCLDQPTSGQVFINGKDVTRLNRNQRAAPSQSLKMEMENHPVFSLPAALTFTSKKGRSFRTQV